VPSGLLTTSGKYVMPTDEGDLGGSSLGLRRQLRRSVSWNICASRAGWT